MPTNYNFVNKEERAKQAKEHTYEMENKFHSEIEYAVRYTNIYDDETIFPEGFTTKEMEIKVEPLDSVSAALANYHGKTTILNFASYKNPGGMFLNGSRAQEECLCHDSFLYNVLKEFEEDYYEYNRKHLNRALYENAALYSPNIIFKENYKFDVITCAAPNYGAAKKYQNVPFSENLQVLESRIEFLLKVCAYEEADTLILGAFGCGVFKQDPTETAKIFKKCLNKYPCFSKVVFAVPRGNDEQNLIVFQNIFK